MAESNSKPQAGRVALVTGANTGIGRITARGLARQSAAVFIAGLSLARTQPVLDEIHGLAGGETGLYYSESRVKQPTIIAKDPVFASELWKRSENWVR